MINLVLENCNTVKTLDSVKDSKHISISILKHLNTKGILKVFDEDSLMLVLNTSNLKTKSKIDVYSTLHNALKRYEMNLQANVFNPTVEVA